MNETPKVPDEIIERIAGEISRRYRIVPDAAKRVLIKHMAADKKLSSHLETVSGPDAVEHLHEFKKAVKEAKKEIYYNLRRYHRNKQAEKDLIDELRRRIESDRPIEDINHIRDELLLMHSSTEERFEHYTVFYEELFKITSPPETILDVACGLHPLSYPFEKHRLKRYVGIDRDELCVKTIETFSEKYRNIQLRGILCDIDKIEWQNVADDEVREFDFAFMLKLIPVVKRQNENLLHKLAEAPAGRILITANVKAMVKWHEVSRREDRALKDFIEISGRKTISDFRIPNEFGYLIE